MNHYAQKSVPKKYQSVVRIASLVLAGVLLAVPLFIKGAEKKPNLVYQACAYASVDYWSLKVHIENKGNAPAYLIDVSFKWPLLEFNKLTENLPGLNECYQNKIQDGFGTFKCGIKRINPNEDEWFELDFQKSKNHREAVQKYVPVSEVPTEFKIGFDGGSATGNIDKADKETYECLSANTHP